MLGTAGSTTDPLQDTAEPVGEVGGVSGKTYFRKGRRHQTEREGWGVCGMKSEKQQKEHQGQRRKTLDQSTRMICSNMQEDKQVCWKAGVDE